MKLLAIKRACAGCFVSFEEDPVDNDQDFIDYYGTDKHPSQEAHLGPGGCMTTEAAEECLRCDESDCDSVSLDEWSIRRALLGEDSEDGVEDEREPHIDGCEEFAAVHRVLSGDHLFD